MLDLINKMANSFEKIGSQFIEELINTAQPFIVYVTVDNSWNCLFNDVQIEDEGMPLEISIDEESLINAFIEKKDSRLYFTYLLEDPVFIKTGKLKLSIPLYNINLIVINDGVKHNFIANPTYHKPMSLTPKDIEEFTEF